LKSYEAFSASVYAKAEVKRRKIETRNRHIRAASVSLLCCMVIAAVALRAPQAEPPRDLVSLPQIGFGAVDEQFGANARWVQLYDTAGDDSVVVLNSPEEKNEFISNYKKDNNLNHDEELPVAPKRDAAKTIHSAQELAEYLDALPIGSQPKDTGSLKKAVQDYDEEFFSENDLQATPLEINPKQPRGAEQGTLPRVTMPTIAWTTRYTGAKATTTEPSTGTEEPLQLMPTLPTEEPAEPPAGEFLLPEQTEPGNEAAFQLPGESTQSEMYLLVLEPTKK